MRVPTLPEAAAAICLTRYSLSEGQSWYRCVLVLYHPDTYMHLSASMNSIFFPLYVKALAILTSYVNN